MGASGSVVMQDEIARPIDGSDLHDFNEAQAEGNIQCVRVMTAEVTRLCSTCSSCNQSCA